MTEIIIQVRGRDPDSVGSSVRNVQHDLSDQGFRLDPLYPGTSDPELSSWFLVTLTGPESAELMRELQRHSDVEAAYEKPEGEPP